MQYDTLWRDARLVTLAPDAAGLGIIEHGAIAAKDGRIVFAGPYRRADGVVIFFGRSPSSRR